MRALRYWCVALTCPTRQMMYKAMEETPLDFRPYVLACRILLSMRKYVARRLLTRQD